jgi:hypothetical protein
MRSSGVFLAVDERDRDESGDRPEEDAERIGDRRDRGVMLIPIRQ